MIYLKSSKVNFIFLYFFICIVDENNNFIFPSRCWAVFHTFLN